MDSTNVSASLDKQRARAKQARDVRHASEDADLHPLREPTGDAHIDHLVELGSMEPGSAAFNQAHLVGSMAPEEVMEVMGPIGPEGFGIIRRLDGVTGEVIDTPRIYLPGDA